MRVRVGAVAVALLAALVATPAHAEPLPQAPASRTDPAAPGPFAVASTTTVGPCRGPAAVEQTGEARRDRVFAPLECTDAAPIGTRSGTGVNFYYPIDSGRTHPLVVFSGGFGANPGYFDRLSRHFASHGYVVAVSYQLDELVPYSTFRGIRRAVAADADRRSPLFGRIDLRSVVIAGHSYGATNALHAADLLGLRARGIATPAEFSLPRGVRVVGVVAIGPAVGTVANAVATPTLVMSGTRDIVAPPREIRRTFDGIVDAPAWWAVVRDATHLMTLGPVAQNTQAGIETAFLDYVTTGANCARFASSAWPADARVADAARNPRARSAECDPLRAVR
ncbi:MAG: hypothetical protein NTW76_03980 [Corynebacteriales bacterium]|uniref:PET hydrolase/cutinase-like domain-containing protein n=1 Tax=Williamsia herbipolensis TaxID=1603258 RepID=A0AAU4JZP8_9NOCA|nr:hypothetical protein [Williamsia herbipolensis]MCX6468456.1 hypothetical protein [Mycobacteriales bacterium]